MKEKKEEIFIVIGCLLVIVLSVTFAWFSIEIIGESKEVTVDSTDLKIVFTSGSGTIVGTNIEPGWSSEVNTFTVKNNSKDTYEYNIIMKDLVNTFVTDGFLVYKITSDDGGYNMSEFKSVPQCSDATNTVLAHSIEIGVGETHSYSIIIKYLSDENVDQSDDMGKVLTGSIFIEKGSENLHGNYQEGTLGWKILDDNPSRSSRTSFNTTYTSVSTGRIYLATEKNIHNTTDTTVYYYAGNTTNNWVYFAGYYWRIIRTNADGSIRLLYSGTSPDTTSAYIGPSKFNNASDNPMYVGYMYGPSGSLENNRKNTTSSAIKEVIDSWYSSNLSSYTSYISTTAVYCNDRNVEEGTYNIGSTTFHFASRIRAYSTNQPTYDCTNSKDAFSGSNSEAKLTYPIALMTVDEIMYAGGKTQIRNPSAWYYLNSESISITGTGYWWLLTPYRWYGDNGSANSLLMLGSTSPGSIGAAYVIANLTARPVISIKSCALWSSGNGTSSSPYQVSGGC